MMLKSYALPVSIIFLAFSVIWHASNNRYEIAVYKDTENNQQIDRFIVFDRKFGFARENCTLETNHCTPWQESREKQDAEFARYKGMGSEKILQEKRKEAGLIK